MQGVAFFSRFQISRELLKGDSHGFSAWTRNRPRFREVLGICMAASLQLRKLVVGQRRPDSRPGMARVLREKLKSQGLGCFMCRSLLLTTGIQFR